jgi:chitinase
MKTIKRLLNLSVTLVALCGLSQAQQQYRVVGYYASWSKSALPVSSIKFNELTHIVYAFAGPNADGTISGTADTALIGATHRAGRKILISLGGAGSGSAFTAAAADSIRQKAFINNLVDYVIKNHYDGADFDWESPGNSSDSIAEHALMKQAHHAFQQTSSNLLLTMAIGSSDYIGRWRNYLILNQYVDWYNVMTYDMDQGWSGKSGYNAALYYHNIPNDYSVDQSITYLRGRSIPSSKIVVGVPFYGKFFTGSGTFNSSFTNTTAYTYSEIITQTSTGSWTYNWDDVAKVPYKTNGSSVITFDDSMSIALKCQYLKAKGLAGAMIWELSQDVIGQNQPLLDAICTNLLTTTGVAQPAASGSINYELYDNYPNPFNPSTTIRYTLPKAGHVSLKLYDVMGREVATLLDEIRNAGTAAVQFDASEFRLTSGVYFYRINAGDFVQSKKLVLLK